MTNNNLYVIAPTELFQAKYDEYLAKGFENKGAIRYNLTETLVLIEEDPQMFTAQDLALPGVQSFTHAQIITFLENNKADWEKPVDQL